MLRLLSAAALISSSIGIAFLVQWLAWNGPMWMTMTVQNRSALSPLIYIPLGILSTFLGMWAYDILGEKPPKRK